MTEIPAESNAFVKFGGALADLAARESLPRFRSSVSVENKIDEAIAPDTDAAGERRTFDPVTLADRNAERIMRNAIAETYPDHGIIGEEYGRSNDAAEHIWVLDPIDGTRAFICGIPTWGTLIGLLQDGCAVAGVMDQPYLRERFSGDGNAAWLTKGDAPPTRLATSGKTELATAYLTSTSPHLFATGTEDQAFHRVRERVLTVRYGLDCYGYCLLAAGHIDCVVEAGLAPYDIVALIPIVEGAGGIITTWDGAPATNGGRIAASATPELHSRLLDTLAG